MARGHRQLFRLFDSDSLTPRIAALRRVGEYSFLAMVVFVLLVVSVGFVSTLIADRLLLGAGIAWLVGLGLFVVVGASVVGSQAGKKTLGGSLPHVFLKTCLYVLLPCLVITGLAFAWAYATNQPVFR
jgi:hypothetical protein